MEAVKSQHRRTTRETFGRIDGDKEEIEGINQV
jgi:hypothetical protein